ncbi:MAG: zf-HC2 domain-containing protein [Spirochaetia bacterium]|nr:zf-HC2 domain-containing protein [Spirochaetia bacterium]
MECKTVKELLYDYTKNEISAGQKESIASHIKQCHECTAEYDELIRLKALFGSSLESPSPVVLASIREKLAAAPSGRRLHGFLRPVIGIAAAVMIIASAGFYTSGIISHKNNITDYMIESYEVVEPEFYDNTVYNYETDILYGDVL